MKVYIWNDIPGQSTYIVTCASSLEEARDNAKAEIELDNASGASTGCSLYDLEGEPEIHDVPFTILFNLY